MIQSDLWVEREHPIYTECKWKIPKYILDMQPRYKWQKANLSIIFPACSFSKGDNGVFELYDGKNVRRFATLAEAQSYGDSLVSN